jgi:F-type H+-transporting ATPase subunit epsilon
MRLKVLLPNQVLVDEEASQVVAEGGEGHFCLEPRHIDYVSALVPGILSFVDSAGREVFLAVDEGALVKAGNEVLVSCRRAVRGGDLGSLRQTVEQTFLQLDEREKEARTAMAKIEAGFVRRFLDLARHG